DAQGGRVPLIDVQGMAIDQGPEGFASAFRLAGGDRDRRAIAQQEVTIDIPRPHRFLQPSRPEFGKLLSAAQGGARVPNASGVDEKGVVRADAFTGAPNQYQIQCLALAHGFPPELYGAIAALDPFSSHVASLGSVSAEENAG